MQCPICEKQSLVAGELEPGLVAQTCGACSGTLLPLLNYRYWLDTTGAQHDQLLASVETSMVEDSKPAKCCPKCNRLMRKFRVGASQENRLELCSSCDHAWLDAGEWSLLKQLQLSASLPEIFTDSWQRKIRKQQEEANWNAYFSEKIGEESFQKVKSFKDWMDAQPSVADIKHYINIRYDQ